MTKEAEVMDKNAKIKLVASILLVALAIAVFVVAKPAPAALAECKDGVDNDGDGKIDYGNDLGCASRNDNDETNCGDGVCEGGETYGTCPADCKPADSCSDTDGGFVLGVAGTVSGYSGGVPYSNLDYCVNSSIVKEYWCNGISFLSGNYACSGNFTGCVSGACI